MQQQPQHQQPAVEAAPLPVARLRHRGTEPSPPGRYKIVWEYVRKQQFKQVIQYDIVIGKSKMFTTLIVLMNNDYDNN